MAQRWRRLAAVALSGVFHLAVFGWLLHQRDAAAIVESPPMIVSLVTSPLRPSRAPPVVAHKRAEEAPAPAVASPVVSPSPQVAPRIAPQDAEPGPGEANPFRQTLRGLVGCAPAALAGMSAEARRRCQDQLAARTAKDRDWAQVGLDKTGAFAASQNPEAYLNREPHNGCKIRAAGDTDIRGKEGARAAFACAFSF